MPLTTPAHPVTLGDLRLPCKHKQYVRHGLPDDEMTIEKWKAHESCEGGYFATAADLVSALYGPGGMLDLLIKGGFLKVVVRTVGIEHHVYYEVAEAQPFPPAGR